MRALIFVIFGLLRAVPIRFDESSECYSTCEIYFPVEWFPYCMEHYCADEWEAYNDNTSTTSFTQTTSTTTSTTTITPTLTSQINHLNSSNDPSYYYYQENYDSDYYNDVGEFIDYEDFESYDYNASYNFYDYQYLYEGSDNYEWNDSDDC